MGRSKIQLTLTQDDENGSDAAMAVTIELLTQIGIVPIGKIVLTIECENEDADSYVDDLDAAMSGRPVGIEAVIKTTTERRVERQKKLATVTPMDKVGWN